MFLDFPRSVAVAQKDNLVRCVDLSCSFRATLVGVTCARLYHSLMLVHLQPQLSRVIRFWVMDAELSLGSP